jgi:hypothetical protein
MASAKCCGRSSDSSQRSPTPAALQKRRKEQQLTDLDHVNLLEFAPRNRKEAHRQLAEDIEKFRGGERSSDCAKMQFAFQIHMIQVRQLLFFRL